MLSFHRKVKLVGAGSMLIRRPKVKMLDLKCFPLQGVSFHRQKFHATKEAVSKPWNLNATGT